MRKFYFIWRKTAQQYIHRSTMATGNFVTEKTRKKFSTLVHDQVHEQLNAVVKGAGGVIG